MHVRDSGNPAEMGTLMWSLSDIVIEPPAAEVHRRTLCYGFASHKCYWDTYIKVVIVPGPNLRGVLGQGTYRPIVAQDLKGREQRLEALTQRRDDGEVEHVKNTAGAELAGTRTRLHARMRLGTVTSEKEATQRYAETRCMRELYGRRWKRTCGPSTLRAVVRQESVADGDEVPVAPTGNAMVTVDRSGDPRDKVLGEATNEHLDAVMRRLDEMVAKFSTFCRPVFVLGGESAAFGTFNDRVPTLPCGWLEALERESPTSEGTATRPTTGSTTPISQPRDRST